MRVLILLLCFVNVSADQLWQGKVVTYNGHQGEKRVTVHNWNTFYFEIEGFKYSIDRKKFISILEKFLEWHTKNLPITKKIDDQISTYIRWRKYNSQLMKIEYYYANEDGTFFYMKFSEVTDRSNKYITYQPDYLFFNLEQIKEILLAISDEAIKIKKEEREKKEKLKEQLK